MTNELRTAQDYELFLYSLTERFSSIRRSTVTFVRMGATLARVVGEVSFEYNIRLIVRERSIFNELPATIDGYGYEVWREKAKLYWYDSQPHPNDPSLQVTHPHHKHIPPDIKHHRVPAPSLSFTQPNLPAVIREIETLIQKIESAPEGEQE